VTLALAYGVAPEARAVESTVLASWGIEDEASTVRVLEAGAPAGGASSARSTPKPVLAAEPALPAEGAAGNLPAGNRSRGIKIFKQCQTCHSVRPGEHNSFGPNLHGVIGRQAAAVEGYPYSEALRKAGFAWTIERLDAYLADPRGYLPGARMLFKGLKDPQDRADVLAYIEAASRRK
jgi:cytochrome c